MIERWISLPRCPRGLEVSLRPFCISSLHLSTKKKGNFLRPQSQSTPVRERAASIQASSRGSGCDWTCPLLRPSTTYSCSLGSCDALRSSNSSAALRVMEKRLP